MKKYFVIKIWASLFSSSSEEDQGRILPSRIVLICLGKGQAVICASVHPSVSLLPMPWFN